MALALGLLPAIGAADIFSPGELARPHAELEGVSNCTRCHPAGQQLSQDSCLACHVELKPQVAKGSGFHGHIAGADRNCERCHREHAGRQTPLVQWGQGGQKAFNHARTGWALQGKHAAAACDACHQKRRIRDAPVLAMLEKQSQRATFLGLPGSCPSCHFDEHRGQLGPKCEACHVEKGFKPAPGFTHADTDYPLTGKHKKVACDKCHARVKDETSARDVFPAPVVPDSFLKYSPLEHKTCLDCHKDPHDNRFGQRCSSCHSPEGWNIIRNASQERAFHDKTRFPLKGEHLEVACVSCHGPFPGQPARFKGLKFDDCFDCHADAHFGQLSKDKKKPPDCDGCHGVDGFVPVRFTLKQHEATRYPLEGAHQTTGCGGCHTKVEALVSRVPPAVRSELKRKKRPELFSFAAFDFKGDLSRCDTCHADVHQGQLKDKPCSTCHRPVAFAQLAFDHARDTRYPLTGAHAQAACGKCHAPEKRGGPVKYRGLPTTCGACHADVHAGQLAPSRGGVTACDRCHQTTAFKDVLFKHQPPFTAFLLEGKHTALKCEACHKPVLVQAGVTANRYKPLPQSCEGCHTDFHQGAFRGFEP